MGEVVNLRLQRKRAARRAADAAAAENRTAHGLPKLLRRTATREAERRSAELDGHRLDPSPGASPRTSPAASPPGDDAASPDAPR